MEYSELLENIVHEIRPYFGKGKVANYIPALANVPATKFGMAIATVDGAVHTVGDAEEPFSIQSISKAFTLMLAMRLVGDELWTRCGKEPSGSRFNSLVQLEYEEGVPRNPFINAGALVVTDCVMSHCRAPKNTIRDYARVLSRNFAADFDEEVARSERETGFTNAALANLLASHGRLGNPVAAVLDTYFHQCSLAMSCADLARAFLPLANRGLSPILEEAVLTERQAKRINALMLTCGLYESVGSFAYRVGLPAKSGVGGGIVAVLPAKFCVAVWSPELDRSGNSLVGTAALEALTRLTQLSIF
jgi:glutaminase